MFAKKFNYHVMDTWNS